MLCLLLAFALAQDPDEVAILEDRVEEQIREVEDLIDMLKEAPSEPPEDEDTAAPEPAPHLVEVEGYTEPIPVPFILEPVP